MGKDLNVIYEKRAKRALAILIILLPLIGIIIGIAIYWLFFVDHAPQFFPLNNRRETYEITKNDSGIYGLSYSGKSYYDINSVTIAKSPIELEPLVGKKVLLSGKFASSTAQCIMDVCKNIGGPFIGLYINRITVTDFMPISQTPRHTIITYTVTEKDTIGLISEKFNISKDTIRWENNLRTYALDKGQKLIILPVSGVSHKVIGGDTIESIAKKYITNKQKIIDYPFNEIGYPEEYTLIPGTIIIIPDGKK